MKKVALIIIATLLATIGYSQDTIPVVDPSEMDTDYQNGEQWSFYNHNGIGIYVSHSPYKAYGKWHKIQIYLENNTDSRFDFIPEKAMTAYAVDAYGQKVESRVFSGEQYENKISRQQAFAAAMVGFSNGLAAGTSSTTYTYDRYGNYVSTTYNSGAATMAATQNTMEACRIMEEEKANLQSNYLKRNTIYPGQHIAGYVLSKRYFGAYYYLTITINGEAYKFAWRYCHKTPSEAIDPNTQIKEAILEP